MDWSAVVHAARVLSVWLETRGRRETTTLIERKDPNFDIEMEQ